MLSLLLPALLAGAALLAALPGSAGGRLDRVLPRARTPPAAAVVRGPAWVHGAGAGVVGLTVAVLAGGVVGVVLGLALGGGSVLLLRRGTVETPADTVRAGEVPVAVDLLAACLAAGATLDDALAAVAGAVRGPAATGWEAVRAARSLGAGPEEAFRALAGPGAPESLRTVAQLLGRTDVAGLSAVEALTRLAAQERAALHARATAEARQVGVLAVLPLGLCFLPAFVAVGVVPLVAGVAGRLLG